jgi:hypothetical protein
MEPLFRVPGLLGVETRTVVCLLLVVAVGACTTSAGQGRRTARSHTTPTPNATPGPSTGSGQTPHCGVVSLTSPHYGSHLDSISGQVGEAVEVFGTTFRGEDGRFTPSHRLEVWWNAKVPATQVPDAMPFDPGQIVLLATVRNMNRCRFRTEFNVPDVRPGTYKIRTFVYFEGGYGWFGWHRFTVEASV